MKTKIFTYLLILVAVCISACKEDSRFETESSSTTPPGVPTNITWKPLYGGPRFHYTITTDEDLLTVNAEYTNEKGDTYFFSSSFYKDSVDIYGLGDMNEHTIYLYGVNRAGVKSEKVPVNITPLEPAISRVASSLDLKAGFSSFFLDWENELEQVVNVYIYFKYKERTGGSMRDLVSVFSSNKDTERRFVNNVLVAPTDPVNISVRVEDRYGNSTELKEFGDIFLQEDYELDKTVWHIPEANDSTIVLRNGERFNTQVPAMFGNNLEGRMEKLYNGIIDRGDNLDFFHTGGRGRTGLTKDGNMPWNIIIDMGDYYQFSRIVTTQRHSGGIENITRGQYYMYENCGEFRLYVFDEVEMRWDTCSMQRTPVPQGISELQYVLLGEAGDQAYFYPDNPQYTKPARWFRYEGLHCFDDNYSSTGANCMSELTLFGVKAK
jgi:hypothetical protein